MDDRQRNAIREIFSNWVKSLRWILLVILAFALFLAPLLFEECANDCAAIYGENSIENFIFQHPEIVVLYYLLLVFPFMFYISTKLWWYGNRSVELGIALSGYTLETYSRKGTIIWLWYIIPLFILAIGYIISLNYGDIATRIIMVSFTGYAFFVFWCRTWPIIKKNLRKK